MWCSEKSIHFMMPESVLNWDQNIYMQFAAGHSGGSLRDNLLFNILFIYFICIYLYLFPFLFLVTVEISRSKEAGTKES